MVRNGFRHPPRRVDRRLGIENGFLGEGADDGRGAKGLAHSVRRDLYARTKLALAQREWKYVENYADAKSIVVEQIISRA